MNYALIKNGDTQVENLIVADENTQIDGYYIIKINAGVFCQIGNYYNQSTGLFYVDTAFTTLTGLPAENNAALYRAALGTLSAQYQSNVSTIEQAFGVAALAGGSAQASKQAALQSQYGSLKSQFSADLAALKSQYGV
ncbi:hypothetical protein [Dickeya solani]|uniref:Uncharacterized protein n=1 Tax=Dickeya solani D s0432-1 TaxID=1231725 RepID=A0AAV3K745_9GAMM|nr:hypothetical protein [Dickeya solani]ANE74278.1 hypothetical protein A4U42_02380 [Dickeya solani IPO 2222]AUC41485.1 hypothetical protein D083_1135 [Dickeya solani RNS 08.23.3.1.A]AUH10309.1 hypothetical protein BJD21_18655 [Dickeya solani D s0432-1]AUH14250.1 hypothetical protein BJJ98_18625 [Dickeya solani]AYQ48734.1 hypothetical protein CTB91_02947 [Dickeya solani]